MNVSSTLNQNCPRSRRDELMRVVDLFFNPHLMKCLNGIEGKSVDLTIQVGVCVWVCVCVCVHACVCFCSV